MKHFVWTVPITFFNLEFSRYRVTRQHALYSCLSFHMVRSRQFLTMHCRGVHVINHCLRLVWPFLEKQSYFFPFFHHETGVPVDCLSISALFSLCFGFSLNFALESNQVSIWFVLASEIFLINELELSHVTDVGVVPVQLHICARINCDLVLSNESSAWNFIGGTKKLNTLFSKIC